METTALLLIALLVVMVGGCWFALFQLIKQQGRILVRLDDIDKRVETTALAINTAQMAHVADAVAAHGEHAHQHAVIAEPDGVPPGEVVPDFRLRDVTGKTHSLSAYRGKRILLAHWSTTCGFCDMIAPELAELQPALRDNNVQLLFVSYGDPEANIRMAGEYGFTAPILLQKPGETIEAFSGKGTPVGYLIDEDGRVMEPIAVGADRLPALARRAASADAQVDAGGNDGGAAHANGAHAMPGAKPLSESRIERDGLKAGTPAPTFTLPDVYGRTVSLDSYRGRRVLLVFSDPNCGPCDELAPHLARIDREHRTNNLAVVMVGRGDLDENREKTEKFGIEFPVVMQEKWKLSKEYGIFATPVGYLIGEDGVIRSDVAMGKNAILSLVDEH